MKLLKILNITILISLFLYGCASGSKDTILPQEGPTMKKIYEDHFGASTNGQLEDNLKRSSRRTARRFENDRDLSGYTRNSLNELRQIFPLLQNKTLVMYVFPHLTKGERLPVPGYSTAFPLYIHPEYALPGEVQEDY